MSVNEGNLTTYTELSKLLGDLRLIVHEARRVRRLSQREAAKKIGCSNSTLSRYESGDDISISNVQLILTWLDS